MKLKDIPRNPPKILLFGPPGAGKTLLTLTLGKYLQMADLDGGVGSGQTLEDKFTATRQEVDVLQFLEPDPLKKATAFAEYKRHMISTDNQCRAKKYPYLIHATDSLSSLADLALNYVMANSGMLHKPPQIQHWGMLAGEFNIILSIMRSLPIPVILIAHDQTESLDVSTTETKDGEEKVTVKTRNEITVGVSGNVIPRQIKRYFDEILYMKPVRMGGGKTRFTIQTVSDGLVTVKSRGNLPTGLDTSQGMWPILERLGVQVPKEIK